MGEAQEMDAVEETGTASSPCADGAAPDFDGFVRASQADLVRYALLLSGSRAQAEDIVQEVLVRMYPRWEQTARRPGSITAYVRRAVTNEHLSWRRRWSTRAVTVVDDLTVHEPPSSYVHQQTAGGPDEALWRCLQSLPARQRAAVVLRYYEGLTDEEIATTLDCRLGTVRSLVSRGLAQLRTMDDVTRAREGLDD
jgi:RNA polymerase sigma-70 factor (sigma-E family)